MATACSSSAASGKKRKRVVLTIEDKLKICDLVKNGRSLTSVAAEFNVGKVNRSLIRTFHLSESLRSQRVRISDTLLYYLWWYYQSDHLVCKQYYLSTLRTGVFIFFT